MVVLTVFEGIPDSSHTLKLPPRLWLSLLVTLDITSAGHQIVEKFKIPKTTFKAKSPLSTLRILVQNL